MACPQISGVTYNCLSNTGGLVDIYVTNWVGVTGVTTDSNNFVTAISMSGDYLYHQYQFNINTSSLEVKSTISLENGTTFYPQVVTLKVPYLSNQNTQNILGMLNGQQKLSLIVEDFNQNYWLVGLVNGAYVTAFEAGTGIKKGDANGYTITFTAEEPQPPNGIDPAIVPALIANY